VIYSAFAPVAMWDAVGRVSREQLEALKRRLAHPDLLQIERNFNCAVFHFFTDVQAVRHEEEGLPEVFSRAFAEVLEPYDEFSYLPAGYLDVDFDSKERLDTAFEGNWFYFWR
jgi:hypothetical protein